LFAQELFEYEDVFARDVHAGLAFAVTGSGTVYGFGNMALHI
jgi:hypothetical protein